MSTPIITQESMSERGFKVEQLVCLKCRQRFQVVIGDRQQSRICCNVEAINYGEYLKLQKADYISVLNPRELRKHLEGLAVTYRQKGQLRIEGWILAKLAVLNILLADVPPVQLADIQPTLWKESTDEQTSTINQS